MTEAIRKQIAAIETRMLEREDCGGLLDELLELRAILAERNEPPAVPFVDVANITEYGLTQKLSRAIRVF